MVRNLVYLCVVNSRNRHYSQCFQYSKTLETVVEGMIEMGNRTEVPAVRPSAATLEELSRAVKEVRRKEETPKTIRILGIAYYYSGKSMAKLSNLGRAQGILE